MVESYMDDDGIEYRHIADEVVSKIAIPHHNSVRNTGFLLHNFIDLFLRFMNVSMISDFSSGGDAMVSPYRGRRKT